jgi:hypothetical protein
MVYLRASTGRQGKGGLGMDAQYAAVVEFVRQHGGTIVAQSPSSIGWPGTSPSLPTSWMRASNSGPVTSPSQAG